MSLVRMNLLFMSVYGGMLILVVLFLRLLLKNRLPKRIFSILWCVALLRLLMPFSVDAPFGALSVLQNQMAALQDQGLVDGENRLAELFAEGLYSGDTFGYYGIIGGNAAGTNGSPNGWNAAGTSGSPNGWNAAGIGGNLDGGNAVGIGGNLNGGNAVSIDGITDRGSAKGIFGGSINGSGMADHSLGKLLLFRRIGMAGTIICAVFFLALYLNCLRRFRTALPVGDPAVERWLGRNRLFRRVRVCCSDRISSPLTYGLIRPVILLPKFPGQKGRNLEYILQHEMVHIRRFDGAWKLAMTAVLCLHWFNPLVWVMYVFMNRDLELSCDEAVLRIFGEEARKGYALTLIGMEESRCSPVSLYSGFGKNAVEERVGEIMKYKKKTKIAVGAGAALILAVACMFATTSKAGEDSMDTKKEQSDPDIFADLPMDPPAGNFGEVGIGDGAADSGTGDGTKFLSGSGRESDPGNETGVHYENRENTANVENSYRLIYIKEGIPESEPARLVTGQGYNILLPQEGWTDFGPDGWMSEINNEVELWVAHFSAEGSDYEGFDREQIAEALKEQGYQESDNSCYWRYAGAEDKMEAVELRCSNEEDVWGVFYTYPGEAEEGWGVELRAMAQTFSVVRPEQKESVSADGGTDVHYGEAGETMAKWLSQILKNASVGDNHESIKQYLAEGYEVDLDILDVIREWEEGDAQVRFHPTEGHCTASIWVMTTESEEDSRDYLTVELLKEGEDWKICFMGLEK